MSNLIVPPSALPVPALVAVSGDRAGIRFLEFFAANIRNPHTRRAYARAVGEFLEWCESVGIASLPQVQPLHVASWIESQGREVSAPASSSSSHLSAICLIGWSPARWCR